MKKVYKKPELYFDSFELNANIALGCALISHHSDSSCPITDKDLGVIYCAEGICTYTPGPGDSKVCYHISADSNTFTS